MRHQRCHCDSLPDRDTSPVEWLPDCLVIFGVTCLATVVARAGTGSAAAGAVAAAGTGVACWLWFAAQRLRDELREDQ